MKAIQQLMCCVLLWVVLVFSLAGPVMAQPQMVENTIQVQGSGSVTARPDAARLTVAVETEARTVEAARNENARLMNSVLQRLRQLGIPNMEIETTGVQVYPVREVPEVAPRQTRQRVPTVVGYRAVNSIRVSLENVNPDRLAGDVSRIIDTALAAGATNISGPSFYLSENSTAYREALTLAVQQARQTAETVARAAGVQITGIYNIETFSPPMPFRATMAESARTDAAATTPIETGLQEVTATVMVRYTFRE